MNDMWVMFVLGSSVALLSGFGAYKIKSWRFFFLLQFGFWLLVAAMFGYGIFYHS